MKMNLKAKNQKSENNSSQRNSTQVPTFSYSLSNSSSINEKENSLIPKFQSKRTLRILQKIEHTKNL